MGPGRRIAEQGFLTRNFHKDFNANCSDHHFSLHPSSITPATPFIMAIKRKKKNDLTGATTLIVKKTRFSSFCYPGCSCRCFAYYTYSYSSIILGSKSPRSPC
jgi:hypothetical protein